MGREQEPWGLRSRMIDFVISENVRSATYLQFSLVSSTCGFFHMLEFKCTHYANESASMGRARGTCVARNLRVEWRARMVSPRS
jgi:hypothetical protein